MPARHLATIEAAHCEHRLAQAAVLHRELDFQHLGLAHEAPHQTLLCEITLESAFVLLGDRLDGNAWNFRVRHGGADSYRIVASFFWPSRKGLTY